MKMAVEILEAVVSLFDRRPLIPGGHALFDVRLPIRDRRGNEICISCVCTRCRFRASVFLPIRRMVRHVARCR